jgi:hypothetical protein
LIWHSPLHLHARGPYDPASSYATTVLAFEVFIVHKHTDNYTMGIPSRIILNMFIYSAGVSHDFFFIIIMNILKV